MSLIIKKMDELILEIQALQGLLRASLNATMNEEEAARLLGLSKSYLQGIREAGEISFIPVGGGDHRHGRILYTRDDIIEYLKKKRRPATNVS